MAPRKVPEAASRTRRVRRVFCEIAATEVRATLRYGRGFHDLGTPYVRCDERDCQYVDHNEPPCPLRVDLFHETSADADTHEHRALADALARCPDVALCGTCLAVTTNRPPASGREIIAALHGDARLTRIHARCSRCRALETVIRAACGRSS